MAMLTIWQALKCRHIFKYLLIWFFETSVTKCLKFMQFPLLDLHSDPILILFLKNDPTPTHHLLYIIRGNFYSLFLIDLTLSKQQKISYLSFSVSQALWKRIILLYELNQLFTTLKITPFIDPILTVEFSYKE